MGSVSHEIDSKERKKQHTVYNICAHSKHTLRRISHSKQKSKARKKNPLNQ